MTKEPIFKSIFGAAWDNLPPVMHKHYANRPYTNDTTIVEGVLDVECSGSMRFLSPLLKLLKLIPPYTEKNVPVTVEFKSSPDNNHFYFLRTFHFKNQKPYPFYSRMVQIKDNDIVEIMRFGLGWRFNYLWQDNKVILKHKGFVFHLFGFFIPLPLTFLIGTGHAEEVALDDQTFSMFVTMTHPLWGKVYEYKGHFKVID